MRIDEEFIDNIDIPARLRALDAKKVDRLIESIKAIGLQQPITLWAKPDDAFILVAGAHRLEAAKRLGWDLIPAIFTDADEVGRQLWEIDENLIRSELTAVEQAEHLARRKELWEMHKIQSQQGAPLDLRYKLPPLKTQKPAQKTGGAKRVSEPTIRSGATCTTGGGRPGENKGFAQETAEATGANKSTITRAVSRVENTTPEARELIKGTPLDTGVYLDKLKNVPAADQVEAVKTALENPEPKAAKSETPPIIKAWRRASQADREALLLMIRKEGWLGWHPDDHPQV